ncbi:MAG: hypothetical protein HKN37_08780, partial [Rhodothermales bacterium]|nr:hypothetical protein [Rhodothermales bacterium]
FRIIESGREIPLFYSGANPTSMTASDYLAFVGRRNTGAAEDYLYDSDPSRRSSTYNSLFSDTTTYWLTWGGNPGSRMERVPPSAGTVALGTTRDTLHLESDNTYYPGDSASRGNPLYTDREGYYWARVAHNTNQGDRERTDDVQLSSAPSSTADTAFVRVRLNSETTSRHHVVMQLRLYDGASSAFVPVDTMDWTGLGLVTLEANIPQNQIPPDGNLRVRLRSRNDFGSAIPNNWFLDWIEVSYVRNLNARAGQVQAHVESSGDYALGLAGFTSDSVLALNTTTLEAIAAPVLAGQATVRAQSSASSSFWISGTGAYLSARIIADRPSNLADASNSADYVIIRPDALAASATALADYRRSVAGSGYEVAEVSLEDIYDQFDYGRPTPAAIRRFVRATYSWSRPPRFVVLWGDALYPSKGRARQPWEVPSFGQTVSDGWYAMQNESLVDWRESVAIGRIPNRSNADGLLFVDKISDYESRPVDRWQKNSAYLVGGVSEVERRILQSHAISWSTRAANHPTALDTLHFFKTSSDALDPTFKDSLQLALQNGLSWLTYFGHSAAQTWEIVTDPPATFGNAGKLPVILSLGCFTGDFASGNGSESDLRSFSEQLILDNLNGGIVHWGASSSGTIGASAALSDEIHTSVFVDSLRLMGEILRVAKGRFADRFTDPLSVKHLLQYGLIGDPATRLAIPVQPDFRMQPEQISIRPLTPIPADSNLTVTVRLENLGLAPADSVVVRTSRRRPDQSTDVQQLLVPSFGLTSDQIVQFSINDEDVGEHTISVDVDSDNRFEEVDELNNGADRSVNVFATGLSIIAPPPLGLVDTVAPTLRVTASRREPGTIPIVFELDTDVAFSSPGLQTFSTGAAGLVAEWQPAGLRDDSTYFWRARIDDGSSSWQSGSFTIDTGLGKNGWMQRSLLFDENETDGYLDWTTAGWSLREFDREVSAAAERGSGIWQGQFVVSGQRIERLTLGFGLLVIDGKTGALKSHTSAATYPNDFFDDIAAYDTLAAQASRIVDGDHVFVRTRHLGNKTGLVEIPDSIKTIFRDLHSVAIDTLTYRDVWIMFSRKGFPAETREWVPPVSVNEIVRDTVLQFTFGRGATATPAIGPAQEWKSFGWDRESMSPSSRVTLDIVSVNSDQVLFAGIEPSDDVDLASIDPTDHPYLALRGNFLDSTNTGTPQLQQWHVEYTPVAELALDPLMSSIAPDTVREGQTIDVSSAVENLSDLAALSTHVDYFLTTASNQRLHLGTDTLSALTGREASAAALVVDTRGLVGDNNLEVRLSQPGYVEPILFNNVLVWPFHVQRDTQAPTVEVLIDGDVFPPDPDPVVNLQDPALPFVALAPTVEIFVNDENEFLSLQGDTTIVRVYLDGKEIPAADLSFGPGKRQSDRATIRFSPDLPASDTTHTIIVEAFDATGNPASDNPYQVHFRTQTFVEVERVYPYPNPMSSSTVFAFRLLGADAFSIDDFRLRIYTINGQLVREFDLIEDPSTLESGALKVGWNKIRWDGRDEDGDLVATGVYLYRVFASAQDESIHSGEGCAGDRSCRTASAPVEKLVVIR